VCSAGCYASKRGQKSFSPFAGAVESRVGSGKTKGLTNLNPHLGPRIQAAFVKTRSDMTSWFRRVLTEG